MVEYELTVEELRYAYIEYEHICDVEDIRLQIYEYADEGDRYKGAPVEWLEEHIDEIAQLKRRYIDKYNTDWQTAIVDALADYIADNYIDEE